MKNKNLHLYSETEKYRNNYQWFKDFMDYIDNLSNMNGGLFFNANRYKDMKINFDLYNNIIDKTDFLEYCEMSDLAVELPDNFSNTDIVSKNIKLLEGIEYSRPFVHKVVAINPEATTRKEQHYFELIKNFVIQEIMSEIELAIRNEYAMQTQGVQLSEEEIQNIEQEIKQKINAMTPEETKRYMERKYQDPAEVLASQLLEYLKVNLDIKNKFNKGWKNGLISGVEVYRVYISNGEPQLEVVNPLKFDFDRSKNNYLIHKGEWAIAEYRYPLSRIIREFPELKKDEIERIGNNMYAESLDFNFISNDDYNVNYIPVRHYVWKSLRPVKFLIYIDKETGELNETIVDESYKLNELYGDIELREERIIEVYEGWKIGSDIYTKMGRVNYLRDLDNIDEVDLPYLGVIYDSDNSEPISIVKRIKPYQYLYNVIISRLRSLMSSDKGKILLMNIGLIPKSQKINVDTWLRYATAMNIAFFNPYEEGNRINDVNASARVLDMSLVSDIEKYVKLAEYIENLCMASIGITREMLGQINPNTAVGNAQQSIAQSNLVIEPYFNLHNFAKKEVLEYLLNIARLAYSKSRKKKLSFVTDDFSNAILNLDEDLLTNNVFGIFIDDSGKIEEIRKNILQIAHAAMQNGKVQMSDIISMLKTENVQEVEEMLKVAETKSQEQLQQMQQQDFMNKQQLIEAEQRYKLEIVDRQGQWDLEKEKLKGEYDLKKQTILSAGFTNTDDNANNDINLMKLYNELSLKERKQRLDELKFEHDSKVDIEKLELEKKKLNKNSI